MNRDKLLHTNRLTQDCTEYLFSILGTKGENNVTPGSTKLKCNLRSVVTYRLLQPLAHSNSEVAYEFLLQKQQIIRKGISVRYL